MEIEKIIVRKPVPMEHIASALAELMALEPILKEAAAHPDPAKVLYLAMKLNHLAQQAGFRNAEEFNEYIRIYGFDAL